MKVRSLLIALLLLSPSIASAVPITSGVWSAVTAGDINSDQNPFWDGLSWDCPTCNAGYLLAGSTGLTGLEYLHDGTGGNAAFRFDDATITPTVIYSLTAWTGGVLGRDAQGAFTYDSGTGRLSNSWEAPQQYALFRRVGVETTEYFMGIEDILLKDQTPNDRDYNDYGVTFKTPTQGVPEPSTLLLMGVSVVGFVAPRVRAFRSRRAAGGEMSTTQSA